MGKIDDMRRVREAQHAEANGAAPKSPSVSRAEPANAPATETFRKPAADAAVEGKCSVCGKVRELQNGLVSNHQKGLGKACPGSRKPAA